VQLPRVALVYPLPDAGVEHDLRSRADVAVPEGDDAVSLGAVLDRVEGVILRGPAKLTRELIADAPGLRVIGAQGSGTDNIDVAAATERGIPVVHGAGIAPRPVAEYVIGGMVAGHRRWMDLHARIVSGELEWGKRLVAYQGMQLTGTTLGIVGYGHIGREVAQLATAAFDVKVLAYDPLLPVGADLAPGERCDDLDDLLDRSHTVSVHVPLSEDTRGLIGAAQLRRIGADGVLIDAARGGVVDEDALLSALRKGELKAAVVDVFDPEPPTPEQMRRVGGTPNLLATPHVAGVTDLGLRNLSRHVVEEVLTVLAGGQPSQCVNPEVLTGRPS
jgi:D-3-phosphoglycerate dehydrogenase / 2-oxoglutarate reductase